MRIATVLITLILAGLGSPVPAQDGPVPDPVVELRRLDEGLWLHTSHRTLDDGNRFPSHGLVVREGEALTLVDTAWGEEETELLLDAIAFQVGLPITRAVVTHFHPDRAAGTAILQAEGIEVWAHPLTRELVATRAIAVPDHVFTELDEPGSTVEFGSLEVFYPGPAHTRDNIMVWLPQQQTLFGGCPVRATGETGLGNTRDGDVQQWEAAMLRTGMLYGNAKRVVSSHADPGGPDQIGHTARIARQAAQAAESEDES